ncbi:MAG: hypothetical protein EAZ95_08415 [Bacteroidetes bacterium]|nr:MAG: hypothetical protein EAZ95_08415 [Bacteroidota bacterium]
MGLAFKTEPLQEQLEILVQTVTNLQKPCLLILDNANEEQDLNDNIVFLRKCANFHILLTSRLADSAYTAKHPLGTLDKKEARSLFEKHYPLLQETEIPLFENIYEAVGGNTLVLELMAKNLTNFNNQLKKRYTLQELKNDLQKGLTRLSQSKPINTSYQAKGTGIRHETPEAIILAMYDLASLTEAETALLSVLSVLPAENIAFKTLERMNPTLTNLSQPATPLDETLLALAQKGWIEQNETAFKISPVVQDITRHKNEHRLLIDCEEMTDFLLNNLHPENNENYHQENYKHTTLYAYYAESIVHYLPTHIDIDVLLERIGAFHVTIGNLTKALDFYEKQHQTIKKLASQNPHNPYFKNDLAISYQYLGNMQASIGNLQEAWRFFETYNQLMKELHDTFPSNVDYKNNLAVSYQRLGDTQASVGNLQEAWRFFETYNQLMKELHDAFPSNVDYKNHLAISYQRLGDTQASIGNWQEAWRFFETSNQLAKELHDTFPSNVDYKNGLTISYAKLGSIHIQLDKVTEAKDNFVLCHSLSLALYQAFSTNINFVSNYAESLAVLNAVEALLGNTTHYTDLSKAQALFEDLYTQSTAIDFLKKADLIKQLQHTPSALKTFIIEISKF